jgi:small nuclear ribonucleoprotein (snRNP)-like protein
MQDAKATLAELIGQEVVLDTTGQFVYIGRLKNVDELFFEIEDADVHDASESASTKELYVMDAKKYGIKKNRRFVFVRASQVVSLSRLEDIIEY